jgi:zinc protease
MDQEVAMRTLLAISVLWAAAVPFLLCTVASASEGPKRMVTVEGITEYQLENGLRLLLYPDSSRPKVTVNMTVLVGSRHEGYGETGMAHLLEHLVFKGTPTHPDIPKVLREHGAQFNGTTSADRTNYFETVPASDENLDFFIRMEADRLVNSYIRKEDLDSEMTVVRNEFERGENSPTGVLMKRIAAAAYNWHNYGKSTIGNRSDIERVPIENLRAFYQKYYQPDNVVLVVAGQFDEAKALALVQTYFGAIPRPQRELSITYTEEPAQDGEKLVTLRRVGDVGAVGVAYHIPAGPHEDWAPLQVLTTILSSEPSGRLYKALVETKKASRVYASARGQHDPGLLMTQAEVRDPKTLDEVRDIIIATVEDIGMHSVTAEEVNRARQQLLKARELAASDTNQTAIALSEWAAQGDWRLYFLHRDRLEQVTSSQVQAVAARYLQSNNRTVGLFIPADAPQRITIPATPDVSALVEGYTGHEAIAVGEVFDATSANIEGRVQRMNLPEGIKATLLQKKTRGQEVQLVLTLRYGNEENLKGYEAAAGLLPSLMLRGTKQHSYQQLRDELDRLRATLGTSAGGGRGGRGRNGSSAAWAASALSFSIQTKRDSLPAVLEILRQVLREPALPADQFELIKREWLASMEQSRTEPDTLANRRLRRQLAPYAEDDIRYVPTIEESIDRLAAVHYDQVLQLYHEYLGSQAGELAIIGDFDAETCLPILKQALGGWTPTKSYARIVTPAPAGLVGSQQQISTPDKANATYMAGIVFPLRDDNPDYPALVMANYIFGGNSLDSRLGTRVRQQEGLSYSVGSNLSVSSFDARASLTINAICNPHNIDRVEKAIHEELVRLRRDGVTTEELARAKQGFLEAQKVRRTTDGALAGLLSDLSYAGRTMTYQAELEGKIDDLTPEQIIAAVRNHLDPQNLVIVTAGDFGTKAEAGK